MNSSIIESKYFTTSACLEARPKNSNWWVWSVAVMARAIPWSRLYVLGVCLDRKERKQSQQQWIVRVLIQAEIDVCRRTSWYWDVRGEDTLVVSNTRWISVSYDSNFAFEWSVETSTGIKWASVNIEGDKSGIIGWGRGCTTVNWYPRRLRSLL